MAPAKRKKKKRAAKAVARWTPAYIGVGSNLNEPEHQVRRALAAIGQIEDTRLVAASRLYRNPPMGRTDQPDFVNAAVGVLTVLEPEELLLALQKIEVAHGRTRPVERWGPRVLDLDLLVYGQLERADGTLTLPHPGVHERPFVLVPLADFAPELDLPGGRGRVGELAAACERSALTVLT